MPGFLAQVNNYLPSDANLGIMPHMTVIELAERMDATSQRVRSTLQAIRAYRDLTEGDIALRVQMSRSKINSYLNGPTKITAPMLTAFAYALQVPEPVLLMTTDDALRWVLQNAPNGPGDGGNDVGDLAHRRKEVVQLDHHLASVIPLSPSPLRRAA
jgi:transcriptional regulator with XRE-family HTH domain